MSPARGTIRSCVCFLRLTLLDKGLDGGLGGGVDLALLAFVVGNQHVPCSVLADPECEGDIAPLSVDLELEMRALDLADREEPLAEHLMVVPLGIPREELGALAGDPCLEVALWRDRPDVK